MSKPGNFKKDFELGPFAVMLSFATAGAFGLFKAIGFIVARLA